MSKFVNDVVVFLHAKLLQSATDLLHRLYCLTAAQHHMQYQLPYIAARYTVFNDIFD